MKTKYIFERKDRNEMVKWDTLWLWDTTRFKIDTHIAWSFVTWAMVCVKDWSFFTVVQNSWAKFLFVSLPLSEFALATMLDCNIGNKSEFKQSSRRSECLFVAIKLYLWWSKKRPPNTFIFIILLSTFCSCCFFLSCLWILLICYGSTRICQV